MDPVTPFTWWTVSPLSNSAMRADLLSDAWLRLRCRVVLRDVDLTRDSDDSGSGDGGLDLFLLLEAPRGGFGFLPRPRCVPLRI
jgi:hypothetical protein